MAICDPLCDALGRVDDFDDALGLVRDALDRLGVVRSEVILEPSRVVGDREVSLPVLGANGVVATIACSASQRFTAEQVRELMVIATCLSVWCTQRGVGTQRLDEIRLTPRQLATARLAARGATNADIAVRLDVSINTVKMRLKQVFELLDVSNRTELANVLRSWAAAPSRIH
jgi:DNA-binding CsgD family transcriptional regulator